MPVVHALSVSAMIGFGNYQVLPARIFQGPTGLAERLSLPSEEVLERTFNKLYPNLDPTHKHDIYIVISIFSIGAIIGYILGQESGAVIGVLLASSVSFTIAFIAALLGYWRVDPNKIERIREERA